VFIGQGARVDADITILGDDNVVEIGAWSTFNRTQVHIRTSGASAIFGQTSGIAAAGFHLYEPGKIVLGDNCGVAADCWVSNSDLHPVYDDITGRRINPARDVVLGDRVGLGLRVIVLRGARIGAKSLIGAGSVVRGRIPAGSLVTGNPAKVLRGNIRWEWNF
jgi:acetyltransferase-like isoleucine patch superfamily enzyme